MKRRNVVLSLAVATMAMLTIGWPVKALLRSGNSSPVPPTRSAAATA